MPNPKSTFERIKKIQEEIGDKQLFNNITNPSEWQRELRREWDSDFDNIIIPPSGGKGA